MKILLFGESGSGKDTIADMLVDAFSDNGFPVQKLAFADPMKRLAKNIVGFSDLQLWGPSGERNRPDPRLDPDTVRAMVTTFLASDGLDRAMVSLGLAPGGWERGTFRVWLQDLGAATAGLHGQRLTPRYMLQTLGTEVGRAIDKDLWVKNGVRAADTLLGGGYAYTAEAGFVPDPKAVPPVVTILTDGRFRNEALAGRREGMELVRVRDAGAPSLVGATHASETEQRAIPDFWFDTVIRNQKSGLRQLRDQVRSLYLNLTMSFGTIGAVAALRALPVREE